MPEAVEVEGGGGEAVPAPSRLGNTVGAATTEQRRVSRGGTGKTQTTPSRHCCLRYDLPTKGVRCGDLV